eukprot:jgi/Chlat1/8273/Chrsp78S09210
MQVPRDGGITDGIWDKADTEAVSKALKDEQKKMSVVGGALLGRSLAELEDIAVATGQFLSNGERSWGLKAIKSKIFHIATAPDQTAKLLLQLEDNRVVETVGIPADEPAHPRLTVCVSSQVGCPMRCTFCATGKGGFARNLKVHEIVDQVLAVEEHFQRRVSNVVFMGMGEPLLNLSAVVAAQRCLNQDVGIGQRMITISTVGVPNAISRLAQLNLQSTLAVSLHAPNQKLREQLVPSAKAYPLEALMQDCASYFSQTSRRVSFEYVLLAGVNDQKAHAEELARLLRRWQPGSHVNLIPYNPIDDADYQRPSRNASQACRAPFSLSLFRAFAAVLREQRITVSIRQTRGLEASAACGQLRNAFQKSPYVEPLAA